MIVDVDGLSIHASTGGVDPAADGPLIVLVHGAGMNSTAFQLQTRFLSYRGYRAVAVDLPGHGQSAGEPIGSVPEMGSFLARFIETLGWGPATIVGHSMGTFMALEVASHRPELVTALILLGTATSMPVHPDLLDKAANDVVAAAALMAAWGHAKAAHMGLNPTPGMWMIGGQQALVEMSGTGTLTSDLSACATYEGAADAAAATTAPTTVVIGQGDRMTPPKAARALAAMVDNATVIELADVGHNMMFEAPRAVRRAIVEAASG